MITASRKCESDRFSRRGISARSVSPTSPTRPRSTAARRPRCRGLSSTWMIVFPDGRNAWYGKSVPSIRSRSQSASASVAPPQPSRPGHPDRRRGCRPPARPCRGRRTRSGPAASRRAAAPRRARCGCPRRRGSRSSSAPAISCDRLVECLVAGPDQRPVGEHRVAQHRVVDRHRRDVTGQDDHAHAALEDGRLQRQLGDAGHLARGGDERAVVGAARRRWLGVGLLEVPAADLGARDVRRDGEHGRRVALAVVQAVDQVQAARVPTTRGQRSDAPRPGRRHRPRTRRPPRCAHGRTRCPTRAFGARRRSGSPSHRRCRTPSGSRPPPSGRPGSLPPSAPCAFSCLGPGRPTAA